MKKLKVALVAMIMVVFLLPGSVLAANSTSVFVNTRQLKMDVAPVKMADDVLAPANNYFEALKISYKINSKDNTVTATYNNKTVWLQANNLKMKLNGKLVNLKYKPLLLKKKILIPVRFVSGLLGISAIEQGQWSAEGQYRIDIYSSKPSISFSQIKYSLLSEVTSDGLTRVQQNSDHKFGFINQAGIEVIKPIYEDATDFKDQISFVKRNGKWGIINTSGKEVVAPVFEDVRYYSKGLAAVCQNKLWGYYDTLGHKMVITPQFTNATAFYGAYAAVTKTGAGSDAVWKVIDRSGKLVDGITGTMKNNELPEISLFADNTCSLIFGYYPYAPVKYMLSTNGFFSVNDITYLAPGKYITQRDNEMFVINSKNETVFTAKLTGKVHDRFVISTEFIELGLLEVYGTDDTYYYSPATKRIDHELFTLDFQSTGVTGTEIDKIGENMLMVTSDEMFRIYDSKLNKQFEFANDGSHRLVSDNSNTYEACVGGMMVIQDQRNGSFTAVDTKGTVQFELKCKDMRSIGEQRFYATVVDEWGNERGVMLNSQGKIISEGNITFCTEFSKGIIFIESDKYKGYVDKNGKHLLDIPASYSKPDMLLSKAIRDRYDLFEFNEIFNRYGYSYQVIIDKSSRNPIPVAFFKLKFSEQDSIVVMHDWNRSGYLYINK